MTAATRPRILIVAPGNAASAPPVRALVAAGEASGTEVEVLQPATENALRSRLSAGGVGLLYFLGRGKSYAGAGHATLEFEAAAAPGPRAVNLRHLTTLLSGTDGPALVVLQPVDSSGAFEGLAQALVQGGVRAAIVWPAVSAVPLLAEAAKGLFSRWQDAAALETVARVPGVAAEWAGQLQLPVEHPALTEVAAPAAAEPAPPPEPAVSPARRRKQEMQERLAAKRHAGEFDVFLCHNGADKPAVRAIAQALKQRGVLPWLDEWELPPGQPWQPLLERQIASIRSAAVCVGAAGVGPWQEQELYGFLREFVARRAPIIPVLLPDAPSAPELPVFLRAMTYVDFRQPEPDPMDRLEWGITGVRPAYD